VTSARKRRLSIYLKLKYLLVLPVIAVLLIFSLYPFLSQIYLSFYSVSIRTYWEPTFVGFDNYMSQLVNPGYFWRSLGITILFVVIVVLSELLLGLGLALLIHPLSRVTKIITSLVVMPMFVAPVFVGALGRLAFHSIVGIVPYYFNFIGISPPSLTRFFDAFAIVCALDIWQWTPFIFLIVHAGLMSLPQEITDAAKVDGAGGWNQFRHITLPLLRTVLGVAIIFRTMDAFRTFDIPYVLNQGGPGSPVGGTTTISILIYTMMLHYQKIGDASAIVVVLLIFLNLMIPRITKYLGI